MLDRFIHILKTGGVVAFPTETVYGLGADARNPDAVRRVFELKGRPADNPLIVHLNSARMAGEFAAEVTGDARALMRAFWPGPLTLILPKRPEVLDLVTGGLDTVALRWPAHPLAQQLISGAGPLVAPSANKSGRPSPTKPEHVREDFGEDFPVVEAGETQIGLESTVLDLSREPFVIHRPGYVGRENIEKVIGRRVRLGSSEEGNEKGKNEEESAPAGPAPSPGTRYSHYAPRARVRWMERGESPDKSDTLYLLHGETPGRERETGDPESGRHLHLVGYGYDYGQMARELYDRFRQADHEGLECVAVKPFPPSVKTSHALAQALANRIGKAIAG